MTDAGLSTAGLEDFVLHSRIGVVALTEGTTSLSFAEGNNLVTDTMSQGSIWDSIVKGTGEVSVATAVPEPSATILIFYGFLALCRRRRR